MVWIISLKFKVVTHSRIDDILLLVLDDKHDELIRRGKLYISDYVNDKTIPEILQLFSMDLITLPMVRIL